MSIWMYPASRLIDQFFDALVPWAAGIVANLPGLRRQIGEMVLQQQGRQQGLDVADTTQRGSLDVYVHLVESGPARRR